MPGPTQSACEETNGELLDHVSHLRAFAISLCGDRDYGDDLVQDTLLKALTHIDSFTPGTNMRSWLFTILRNTYLSHRRKARREVRDENGELAESLSAPAEQESRLELRELQHALMLLVEEQREALILIGAAGFSYQEAAEIMGCSSGTVKSRVNRARNKLTVLLSSSPVASAATEHVHKVAAA
jgi:RNA polymerase sigma-70 factor, ECF subfamily